MTIGIIITFIIGFVTTSYHHTIICTLQLRSAALASQTSPLLGSCTLSIIYCNIYGFEFKSEDERKFLNGRSFEAFISKWYFDC